MNQKYCNGCGASLPEDTEFCPYCGSRLEAYSGYYQYQEFPYQDPGVQPPVQGVPCEQQAPHGAEVAPPNDGPAYPGPGVPYQGQAPIHGQVPPQGYPQSPPPYYGQNRVPFYVPPQQQYYPQGPVPFRTKSSAPVVLGILGIIFSFLLPIVTYPCSIVGLVIAYKDHKYGIPDTTSGMVLNIIALAIAFLNSVAGAMYGLWGYY